MGQTYIEHTKEGHNITFNIMGLSFQEMLLLKASLRTALGVNNAEYNKKVEQAESQTTIEDFQELLFRIGGLVTYVQKIDQAFAELVPNNYK